MTYTTATADAAGLRAFFKSKGWGSRDVSVRSSYFSGGSAIDITIKNPDVPLRPVENAAGEHEKIDRCEASGEILAGANRYVHVTYHHEAEAALSARYVAQVEAARVRLEAQPEGGYLMAVEGTPCLLGYGQHGKGYGYAVWHTDHGHVQACHDAKSAAYQVALVMQPGWTRYRYDA